MSINVTAIAKDFATWTSVISAVFGGLLHKLGAYWVKVRAEAVKLETDVKAEVKKL